ncbi:alpha/beta fold hydrolase [Corallococcus sp. AB049A]|uniref:alpha/beta fold hydrolase n=1 Tax=Corallococcus sp. AB049A TaxID=2316721 RepID=UPI000EE3191A|nr:alpha/beta fold hydrolase [Corallococcus sp. AB049A]RKI53246.1 alpha/beta fold hydrolase [Corallococcus sp. AB049A]
MRLFPLASLMLLSACTASRVALPPPTGEEVTVFIHGYRGSFLATADGERERAWVSVGDLLTRGERSLALPFPGQRATPGFGPLEVDGPMTRFTVLPWVARYDIYKGFLEFARERLPGLVVFDYDWRQDNRVTAKRLCALLDSLAQERGGRVKLNLVAHSMGGLVTLHCLRYGTGRTLAVVGVGHPLIKSFRIIDGKPAFEDPVLADGDGSVLTTRALPPAPLHVDRLETRADHVGMMGDEEVQEAVARFVTGD